MKYFLFKKKSNIHGIGAFSRSEIGKGSVFYIIPIKNIFNHPEAKCAYIGKNRWVSDKNILNFINHSCNPKSILKIRKEPVLVARRKINTGEEITLDYNKTENDGKKVPCSCGEKKCKGYFLRIE